MARLIRQANTAQANEVEAFLVNPKPEPLYPGLVGTMMQTQRDSLYPKAMVAGAAA